ncbi:MAG TPA: transcriptional regulator [Candidatus Janibacter merdipullorum]|nr:transcriptional regulator [Candidatus Janibacter merdipullorum]
MATTRSGSTGRRRTLERAWERWHQGTGAEDGVRPEILSSWRRSAAHVTDEVDAAPLADEGETRSLFEGSPLSTAVDRLQGALRSAAEDGDLVVAVTDPQTRILWTYGGRVMRGAAEEVNFVAGGRWDEASVGTNALNLALRTDEVSTVFAAEHYAPIVHNWVCWAAPVHDPVTGIQLGVLDLTTTWDRAHPIGTATAQALARLLETAIPATAVPTPPSSEPGAGLHLRLLGAVEAHLDGTRLLLTRRQGEILALLAMHPDGLSLGELHAHLYGDERVSTGTLKSEVSHLRAALGGRLASRPYRLDLPVTTDVDAVRRAVRRGDPRTAVSAYGGDLVPGTSSPFLTELAEYLAVAVRECLLLDPDPQAVLAYAEVVPDAEVVQRALDALGDGAHPARAELTARLAAALR